MGTERNPNKPKPTPPGQPGGKPGDRDKHGGGQHGGGQQGGGR